MIGEPAIARVEEGLNARNPGGRIKRPGPPNLPGEIDDGLAAAVDFAFAGGDAHFSEQILAGQVQKRLHTRILQGGEAEAALFQGGAEPPDKRNADRAIAVKADPSSGGVTSFCISHF